MFSKLSHFDGTPSLLLMRIHSNSCFSKQENRKRGVPVEEVEPRKKIKLQLVGQPASQEKSIHERSFTSTNSTMPIASVKPMPCDIPVQSDTSQLARPPIGTKVTTNHKPDTATPYIQTSAAAKSYVKQVYSDLRTFLSTYKNKVQKAIDDEINNMQTLLHKYEKDTKTLRDDFDRLIASQTSVGFYRAQKVLSIRFEISKQYRHLVWNLHDCKKRTLDEIEKLKNEVKSNFTPKRTEAFNKLMEERDKFTTKNHMKSDIQTEELKTTRKILFDAAEEINSNAEKYRDKLLSDINAQEKRFSTSGITEMPLEIEKKLDQDQEKMDSEFEASIQEGITLANNEPCNNKNEQSFSDALETLGVGQRYTTDEIKRAYRKLSLENHPDKHPGNADEYTEKFRKIAEAYHILSHLKSD